MKYILLSLLLTGCTDFYCEKLVYKTFTYQQKVLVTSGFYKNQIGFVIKPTELYNSKHCNIPGYTIQLNTYLLVDIDQYNLKGIYNEN